MSNKARKLQNKIFPRGTTLVFNNMRKREFSTTWSRHQIRPLSDYCQKCVSSTFSIAVYGVDPCTEWNQTCLGLQFVHPGWPETRNIVTFGMTKWGNSRQRPTFERFFSFAHQLFNFQFETIFVRYAWESLGGKIFIKRTSWGAFVMGTTLIF